MHKKLLFGITLFAAFSATIQAAESQNLMDIYQLAVSHDPTLASARSDNTAQQEKLVQGRALYLPNVTFSADSSHSETNIKYLNVGNNPFTAGGHQAFDSAGYRFNVNQPIFRWQSIVQYQQSKVQVSLADKQLLLAQQNLILRVSQAYFDVLLAQDKVDLTGAQKTAINRQLEQAKANFEVGTATITDVNDAKARYDLTVAQELAAVNDLEVKRRAVQLITGELPKTLMTARADLRTTPPDPIEMDKWVETAEQNNLNLIIQQQAVEIASREVEKQFAGHLPTLDAVGSYDSHRGSSGINGFGQDLQNTTIGLQLQIPIYQGGTTNSKVREAVANKQKAQDDLEVTKRQADLDTQQAYLNLVSGVAQVSAYEQALVSSQSQLDSTNLGYEVGIRTSVDVLNAQQQYFSAKRDLLQSRYTYLLSILKLKSAAGLLSDADLTEINQNLLVSERQASTQ